MTTVARDSTNRRSRRFRRPDHCRLHPRFSTNWRYETSNSELVRKYFSGYENKDRKAVESLLSNDFAFTSPHDYRIYRETYFKPDWPYSEKSPTYLAFVELETKAAGMLDFATDLRYPNFAKMAEAAGVLGLKANAPEQVHPLLAQALNHPGATLVEVVVDRQELALPPSIKLDQVKGFSLFMMRP